MASSWLGLGNEQMNQAYMMNQVPAYASQLKPNAQMIEAQKRVQENQLSSLAQEEAGINSVQQQLDALRKQPQKKDISAFLALSDALGGTNLLSGYKVPQSNAAREEAIIKMQEVLQRSKSSFSENQLKLLKDQFDRQAMGQFAQGMKQDNELESNVRELQKRVGDSTPAIHEKMSKLNEAIGALPGGENVDIPGVGSKNVMGYNIPGESKIPDFALSQQGQDIRLLSKGVVSDLIKLQSGTAASEGEVARKMTELGMGTTSTDAQFLKGLKNLQDYTQKTISSTQGAFRPAAVQRFQERGGVGAKDFTGMEFQPGAAQAPTGAGWTPEKEARMQELLRKKAGQK